MVCCFKIPVHIFALRRIMMPVDARIDTAARRCCAICAPRAFASRVVSRPPRQAFMRRRFRFASRARVAHEKMPRVAVVPQHSACFEEPGFAALRRVTFFVQRPRCNTFTRERLFLIQRCPEANPVCSDDSVVDDGR